MDHSRMKELAGISSLDEKIGFKGLDKLVASTADELWSQAKEELKVSGGADSVTAIWTRVELLRKALDKGIEDKIRIERKKRNPRLV